MLAAELETTRKLCSSQELSIALLVTLAQEAERQEKHSEAEALLKRACEQAKSHFGSNAVEVATILWDLAAINEKQGRYQEADQLCSEVRTILGIYRQSKAS